MPVFSVSSCTNLTENHLALVVCSWGGIGRVALQRGDSTLWRPPGWETQFCPSLCDDGQIIHLSVLRFHVSEMGIKRYVPPGFLWGSNELASDSLLDIAWCVEILHRSPLGWPCPLPAQILCPSLLLKNPENSWNLKSVSFKEFYVMVKWYPCHRTMI